MRASWRDSFTQVRVILAKRLRSRKLFQTEEFKRNQQREL